MITSISNPLKYFLLSLPLKRQVPRCEHIEEHTCWPVVTLRIITAIKNLWRHKIRCANYVLHLLPRLLLLWVLKTYQLQLIKIINHNLFRLDISMGDSLDMHVVQSLKQLFHKSVSYHLRKDLAGLLLNSVEELDAINVLHYQEVYMGHVIDIWLVVFHYVGVVQFSQDYRSVFHGVSTIALSRHCDIHSDFELAMPVVRMVNFSVIPLRQQQWFLVDNVILLYLWLAREYLVLLAVRLYNHPVILVRHYDLHMLIKVSLVVVD